jgi:hypothetical protein
MEDLWMKLYHDWDLFQIKPERTEHDWMAIGTG